MLRFAVLCSPDSWYLRDLTRAAGNDYRVEQADFTRLAGYLGHAPARVMAGNVPLDSYHAVIVRTMPPGSLEQVVFRMDLLAQLETAGVVVCNRAKAIETAVDKYLASARLQAAGLPTPPTRVCQTTDEALAAFAELGGDVVLKPLFGAEGRGITRLTDEAMAQRAFRLLEQLGAVIYLQQFIHHAGHDLRVLVVGEQMFAIRRSNALDWRTNCSRGATAEPLPLTDQLRDLARRAAAAVEATVAGVDLLPALDGQLYAIEVNAVPGWQALSRALHVDVARCVLKYVAERVRTRGAAAGATAALMPTAEANLS